MKKRTRSTPEGSSLQLLGERRVAMLARAAGAGPETLAQQLKKTLTKCLAAQWVRVDLLDVPLISPGQEEPPDGRLEIVAGRETLGHIEIKWGHKQLTEAELRRLGRIVSDLVSASAHLTAWRNLALTDELTGIGNRRFMVRELNDLMGRAKRELFRVSLLTLDLDGLKAYNDAHGHTAGDAVLRDVASMLCASTRNQDRVGRIGGDEFAVIIWDAESRRSPGSRHPRSASAWSRRILRAVRSRQFGALGPAAEGLMTLSGGLANYPRDAKTSAALWRRADKALLCAKCEGKNRITIVGNTASCK